MGTAAFLDFADAVVALPFYVDLALPRGVDEVLVASFQLLGYLFQATWIAAAVAFAIWLSRVVRNLPVLGTQRLVSPLWAVLCLFIPFVNLFLPFVVVHHAWQGSEPEPDADGRDARDRISLLVVGWWTAWLVISPVSMLIEGILLSYVLPSSPSGLYPWYIGYPGMALFVATAALAALVVLGLSRRQEARLRRLAAAAAHDRYVAQAGLPAGA